MRFPTVSGKNNTSYLSKVPSKSGSKSSSGSYYGNVVDDGNIIGTGQQTEEQKQERDLSGIISQAKKLMQTEMGQSWAVSYITKQNLSEEEYNKVMSELGL